MAVVFMSSDFPSVRSRRRAVLCQLSMFGLQIVLPAIMLLATARRDRFVRSWSTEALNLQLVWIGSFLIMLCLTEITHSAVLGWIMAVEFELLAFYSVTCGIIGALKSWRGETWRYPINVRIVR